VDLGLKNRIAFVTGASRGIGREIALAYAAEGVHLALFGRDDARCASVAKEVADSRGVRAYAVHLDFEQPDTIRSAVEQAIGKLGSVDILVNCAGGAYRGRMQDIPDDQWERYFLVKPLGLIRMTRETLPYLRKSNQARVINIAGTRGREPAKFSAMAGPINFGTLSATKVMANELGPEGITVNAINPGSTDTGRWEELATMTARDRGISIEEARKFLNRDVPLGRVVLPHHVADLAVFLASARAEMIHGTAINVDGGRTRSI
jgi:NAD(P)-dependent dehydrogenase (short-subunit alcohol dehydrogenase family)